MSVDLSGQRLAHYLVESVIGRGGMSVVYRAVDERLDRPVALKVMSENLSADPEFRVRFTEEARAASAIDHVNVVPLYDFGEAQGWLFIAMRLVNGTDLAREVAYGPLPVRRTLELLNQVGAALDMLHERGLVHLDVKPANVLITRNESSGSEHVYVADFGLTRRGTSGHRTAAGDFLGSPSYASPEHLRGQAVLPSSDMYSLTCMLFTCLAGRAPFVGDVSSVITGHLRGQVPSLSALTGLSSAIDRVVARGMATDPASRYPTSADLLGSARRALTSLRDEDPVPSPTPTPPPPADVTRPGAPPVGWSASGQLPADVRSTGTPPPAPQQPRVGTHVADISDRYPPPQQPYPPPQQPYPPPQQSYPPQQVSYAPAPPGSQRPVGPPAAVGPPPASGPPPARRAALWWWLGGIAVLIVGGVTAGVLIWRGAEEPPSAPTHPPGTTAPQLPGTGMSSARPSGSIPSGLLPTLINPSLITTPSGFTDPLGTAGG